MKLPQAKTKNITMLKKMIFIAVLGFSVSAPAQGLIFQGPYREQLNNEYCSGLFRGQDAYMLAPMDDPTSTSYFSVFQYLQGRIPGLMIYDPYGMVPWVSFRFARPAFFLDEMPVDAALLNDINMNDVAIIKVFRPPFLGAIGNGWGGAIAVYTKKGGET